MNKGDFILILLIIAIVVTGVGGYCGYIIIKKNKYNHTIERKDVLLDESDGYCEFDIKYTNNKTYFTVTFDQEIKHIVKRYMPKEFSIATNSAIQLSNSSKIKSGVYCLSYRVSEFGRKHSTLKTREVGLWMERLDSLGQEEFTQDEQKEITRIWLKYLDKVNKDRAELLGEYENVKKELMKYADIVVITNFNQAI